MHGAESRAALLTGIDFLANAVKVTLGPAGRNVVIGRRKLGLEPQVTKDGVTVANHVSPPDATEQIGADLVREASQKTAESSGDGTTTATLLAQMLAHGGIAAIESGASPVALKRGMDKACELIVKNVIAQSIPATPEMVYQVAHISANGDAVVAKIVSDAMSQIGTDGVATIEESASLDTQFTVVNGLKLHGSGYLSQVFINDPERMVVAFDNALVLLYEGKICMSKSLAPLLKKTMDAQKPLLIIAGDYEADALQMLVTNRQKLGLPVCATRLNAFGTRRTELLYDLAALTGGTAITEDLGLKLETLGIEHLGNARRTVSSESWTTIVEGSGKQEEIVSRVQDIKRKLVEAQGDDKKLLQQRLAGLTSGIAVIKVGAVTITEMREKKDRVEDAMYACKAASDAGVVPGGGFALLKATFMIRNLDLEGDELRGAQILFDACTEPLKQIALNAGYKGDKVLDRVIKNPKFLTGTTGFNARSGSYENLVFAGVIDPTKVVTEALKNATSVAGMILTTEAMVVEIMEPTDGRV